MHNHSYIYFIFTTLLSLMMTCGCSNAELRPDAIKLPPGFTIAVYADDVPGARSMALGAKGTLFVGSRGEGKVYAIIDRNGDHRADEVITVAKGLNMPNGVAFMGNALY